jgi:hypothetical protein
MEKSQRGSSRSPVKHGIVDTMTNPPTSRDPRVRGWAWAIRRAAIWVGAVGVTVLAVNCIETITAAGHGPRWTLPATLVVAWGLPLVAGQVHDSWKVAWLVLGLEVVFGAIGFPVLAFVSFVSVP